MPPLHWPPPLFRQICLLTMIAGMLGPRHPGPAITAALLIAALTFPAARRCAAACLLCLFFALGWGLALRSDASLPSTANEPAWATAAVSPYGAERIPGGAPDALFSKGVPVAGRVREVDRLPGGRVRFLLDAVERNDGQFPPLPGGLVLTWQDPPPDLERVGPGQTLAASLRLREVRSFANPGLWETESYWRGRGVLYRAFAKGEAPAGSGGSGGSGKTAGVAGQDGGKSGEKVPAYTIGGHASWLWSVREDLRRALLGALPRPDGVHKGGAQKVAGAAAVIPALLLGDRSMCDPADLDLVAKATLAHSLALSGMHLGYVAILGYSAPALLGLLFSGLFLRLPRQKAGLVLAAPLCLMYLWLGGSPPSLVRAALMLFFWGFLLWKNRPKVLADGLIWAAAVILLYDPAALYDLRLQLSAVSVAGIALAAPLLDRLHRLARNGPLASGEEITAGPGPGAAPGFTQESVQEFAQGTAAPLRRFADPRRALIRLAWAIPTVLGVSVAAQTAISPLLLDAFPCTGLWLPLNLLWLPVLGAIVMPLSFAGLFCTIPAFAHVPLFPFLAKIFFFLAELPCAALLALLRHMDAAGVLAAPVTLRPSWPAWAGFWLLLLLLLPLASRRAFSRRTACLAILGMALLVGPTVTQGLAGFDASVRLQLVDVGQGQAVLIGWQGIQGKEGRILVDGGGFASGATSSGNSFDVGRQVITPLLTANHAPELAWVVNTHGDADHLQGLLFPLATFKVGAFARSAEEAEAEETAGQSPRSATLERKKQILRHAGITPALWRAGDVIPLAPDLTLEVLHPKSGRGKSASPNNAALVLRLVWQGKGLALICSDIEKPGLRRLLAAPRPDLAAKVLILPHHGSAGSLEPALYDAARPKLALASCGYGNQWRFPAPAVRNALAERGIPLETTADRGQISLTWRPGKEAAVTFARP